jgi:hypothetical protein
MVTKFSPVLTFLCNSTVNVSTSLLLYIGSVFLFLRVSLYPQFSPYILTPWCRVLLEKLTGLQLFKKFPTFHGTRRFITALTSLRQLPLSWTSPIQSIYPHPTSCRSILMLSTHLRLGLHCGLCISAYLN